MKDNNVKITWIIVVAVVVLALIGYSAFMRLSPSETVQVDGYSSISVVPDIVGVYFNVETLRDTAAEAKDANAEITDAVVDSLVDAGLDREDIETQNFNVYENYDWVNGRSVSRGFLATHSLRVKLSTEDIELVGDVIDAGIDSGAQLGYINYELSPELENKYKADALRLATEDARIKAESIADGLGAKLGRIVSVRSNDFRYSPWLVYDTASMGAESGAKIETEIINPSEQDVSASVSVIYKIQ